MRRAASFVVSLGASCRPIPSVLSWLFSGSIVWFAGDQGALLRTLPMGVVTAWGFVLNDILDFQKDRSTGVTRPIAARRLARVPAFLGASTILGVAMVGESIATSPQSAVLAVTVLGLGVYTPLAHRIAALKGLFTATLCCAPLIYGARIAGVEVPIPQAVALMAFIVGREALIDVKDLPGDKAFGLLTLPVLLGVRETRVIGWLLAVGACVGLAISASGQLSLAAGVAAVASAITSWFVARWDYGRALGLTRWTQACGIVSIALSIR